MKKYHCNVLIQAKVIQHETHQLPMEPGRHGGLQNFLANLNSFLPSATQVLYIEPILHSCLNKPLEFQIILVKSFHFAKQQIKTDIKLAICAASNQSLSNFAAVFKRS